MELISSQVCFDGQQNRYQHASKTLNCDMTFAVFMPPQAIADQKLPILYWLSGLTCTDENFTQKAAAQRVAARLGIIIVAPDTSPRGPDVPDDPQGAWDFGVGAGFYINATQAPWQQHYQMHDYIVHELPELIREHVSRSDRRSISGHSMGGHGALVCALRNPGMYCSISAFAPIVNPCDAPWGIKAFGNYLGPERSTWEQWDSCELIAHAQEHLPLLIDQGSTDSFLDTQLRPERLVAAAQAAQYPLTLRMQEGYDHSYFFIASFIEDHLHHHAKALFAD